MNSFRAAPRGWIALTGTPGVGKTTAARRLVRKGHPVLELARFASRHHLLGPRDPKRGSRTVDPARVGRALQREANLPQNVVLEGHWAHDVPGVQAAIVLRLRPRLLRRRLTRRGWSRRKVDENVEAEAIGLILQEAVARLGARRTYEIDATGLSTARLADRLAWTLRDPAAARKKFEVGRVDWAADILGWY